MNRPTDPFARRSNGIPVIITLLFANCFLFLVQQSPEFNDYLIRWLALWPLGGPDVMRGPYGLYRVPDFQIWQVFTYGFLHGGFAHIFFNMFALWMFGSQIERTWGSQRLLVYYVVCVIGAGLVQLVVTTLAAQEGQVYPTLGASGGVFGILLAFGMMFPNQRILLLIPPIPLKAKWFVLIYGVIELWAGITGTEAGIAHFAHLGGMLVGLLLILYWRSRAHGLW